MASSSVGPPSGVVWSTDPRNLNSSQGMRGLSSAYAAIGVGRNIMRYNVAREVATPAGFHSGNHRQQQIIFFVFVLKCFGESKDSYVADIPEIWR